MLAKWLLKHQRSILFLIILLFIGGIFAVFRLPVALFPNIQFPRIVVNVDSGDRSGTQMVNQITKPLEQVLSQVPKIQSIRSTSSRGSADLSVNFAWGTDMVTAALQVQAALSAALPKLPSDTSFVVTRMDPTSTLMMGFSLTSTNPDLVRLKNFAANQLRPLLATIPGIAKIQILGGRQAEYQVTLNPVSLAHYGLTLSDVSIALANNNVLNSLGKMEDRYRLYLVLANNQLSNINSIETLPIKTRNGALVLLKYIATVSKTTAPDWTLVTSDQQSAVLVNVIQQEDGNTVEIVKAVQQRLNDFKSHISENISIKPYYDQSQLIISSASGVRDAIIIGAIFAAIILLLFLRNLRMTIMVAVMLPIVLGITSLLLYLYNMSFNVMTLGGMAAAVGLIIDDCVVMLEHITRRISENSSTELHTSIFKATVEMFRPLIGSSLATIVIFIPLAFLSGVTGGFFKALSLTMATSLVISFFVALLGIPLLSHLFLKENDATSFEKTGKFLTTIQTGYQRCMQKLFKHSIWLLIVVITFIVMGYFSYANLGSGFIPSIDEGGFTVDYLAAPGTSLSETNRLLTQVEKIIKETSEVDTYSRRTGLQLGFALTEANTGDIFIHLKKNRHRSVDEIMASMRKEINQKIPGLKIDTTQLMEDMIGDLTAVPQPIEVKIMGANQTELQKLSPQVMTQLNSIPGVVEIDSGIVISGDSIQLHVNTAKAALFGMTPADVMNQVQTALTGDVATDVSATPNIGNQTIGIRVSEPKSMKKHIESFDTLPIITPAYMTIPLSTIASWKIAAGQAEITRENLQQMVAVTARIEGRDMGSTMKDVQAKVSQIVLPPDVHIVYGGLYQEQQKSFHELLAVFISATLLIVLLLLFLYERFAVVISILITSLLTLPGVFFGLWITNTELNISSIMGMTMILGIATEIAIFYFAEVEMENNVMPLVDTLIHAGTMRMRPILMTSIIAILALLPLAVGIGTGISMQTPLAITIIFGLIFAVPLVLFVMPVLYAALYKVNQPKSE